MNKEQFWSLYERHENDFLKETVKKELENHLKKNLNYFYQPQLEKDEYHLLIYVEGNIFVYLKFRNDIYFCKYFKVDDILSIQKSNEGKLWIKFKDDEIITNHKFYDYPSYRDSIDSLFTDSLSFMRTPNIKQIKNNE